LENFAEAAENDSVRTAVSAKSKRPDRTTRRDFRAEMQARCEEDGFSERLTFSDESTFHISGKVNKQKRSHMGD
jgi:hypothetical protein